MPKVEYISDPFKSNCLLEAMKAKIKNPLFVKITFVRRSEAECPHFLWSDGKNDFDFGVEKHLTGFQKFWFEGCIRKRDLGFNERYKRLMQARYKKDGDGNG